MPSRKLENNLRYLGLFGIPPLQASRCALLHTGLDAAATRTVGRPLSPSSDSCPFMLA